MAARSRIPQKFVEYTKAIHYAINYIEANPIRADYVKTPEDWPWSSARVRMMNTGLVPDDFNVPFLMK